MSRNRLTQIMNQIDPALVEECAVYSPPSERNGMNKHHSRRLAVILLAACLVVALAVTAYATGAIQSLIGKYWSSFSYVTPDDALRAERPDYAQWLDTQLETQAMMLDIGEKAVQTQVCFPIPGLDGAGVTLLEYYYDGEKIALACQFQRMQSQVDLGFEAGGYPNLPFQTVEKDTYPDYRSMVKDGAALQAIEEKLQKDGAVSFLVYDAWISDHVYADGEDLGPCHGDPDENGFFTVDPISMGMGEVVLPESCRNLPEISVSLTYRVVTYAFRLEGETIQYARVGLADYPISFTIPNLAPQNIPARWSLEEGALSGGRIQISEQRRGVGLTIDSPLPSVNPEVYHTITLEVDEEAWRAMGRELVMPRFPQIQGELNSGTREIIVTDPATGNLLLDFDCAGDGTPGSLHYLDVQRNLNGSGLDDAGSFLKAHYLTPIVPQGMEMTGEEAARRAAELLSDYSCFQFTPWNVQAEYDAQKQQGCYRIALQPEYQGIPVYDAEVQAFYSNDGLFSCQGMLLLKECRRTAVGNPVPLEQAIESFVNTIPELTSQSQVRCTAILPGYVAAAEGEEVTLSPAWVFECQASEDEAGFRIPILMENGKIQIRENGQRVLVNPR